MKKTKVMLINFLWMYAYILTVLVLIILGLNGAYILINGIAYFTLKIGDIWILTIIIFMLAVVMIIKFVTEFRKYFIKEMEIPND